MNLEQAIQHQNFTIQQANFLTSLKIRAPEL